MVSSITEKPSFNETPLSVPKRAKDASDSALQQGGYSFPMAQIVKYMSAPSCKRPDCSDFHRLRRQSLAPPRTDGTESGSSKGTRKKPAAVTDDKRIPNNSNVLLRNSLIQHFSMLMVSVPLQFCDNQSVFIS
nr:hypothetical protein Iba_chr01bCG17020 [Ipomoea batatas]